VQKFKKKKNMTKDYIYSKEVGNEDIKGIKSKLNK
jgi:hypothetical protein